MFLFLLSSAANSIKHMFMLKDISLIELLSKYDMAIDNSPA